MGFGGVEKRKGMEGIKNKERVQKVFWEQLKLGNVGFALVFFFISHFLNKFSYIVACSQ